MHKVFLTSNPPYLRNETDKCDLELDCQIEDGGHTSIKYI